MSAAAWTAWATWVSVAIYVVLGFYAAGQLREARRLRDEQGRPFVIVDFNPGPVIYLYIENIGKTMARDVTMTFSPALVSTLDHGGQAWELSSAFTDGIPMLPPRKRLTFLFDSFEARLRRTDLPTKHEVTVTYYGPAKRRKRPYEDTYVLDLKNYLDTLPGEKGLTEVVSEVKALKDEVSKWRHGIRGLEVYVKQEKDERP